MKRGAEQLISSKEKKIKTEQIQYVPNEIWQVIFEHLPPSFWGVVRQVSTEWRTLVQNLSRQSLDCYFSYLINHPDYQTKSLRLLIKEYQRYQKNFPHISMDAILSILQENTEGIVSEVNPVSQKILYGLRFSKGYPLPEKGISEENIRQIKEWAIFFAAWQGNTQRLEELLILQEDRLYKNMALHCAAQNGHAKAVEKLVELGADIDNDGATLIYIAAQNGYTEVVAKLVALGVSVNTPIYKGSITRIRVEAHYRYVNVMARIAGLGADVNTPGNHGAYVAARSGPIDVIAWFRDLIADVDKATKGGGTPIFIAAQEGHAKVVQFLLKQNVRIQPYISSAESLSNFVQFRGGVVIDRMNQLIQEKIQEGNPVEEIPLLPSEIAYIMGHDEIVNMFKTFNDANHNEVVTMIRSHLCSQSFPITFVFDAKKDSSSSSSGEENTIEIDENNQEQSFLSRDYYR